MVGLIENKKTNGEQFQIVSVVLNSLPSLLANLLRVSAKHINSVQHLSIFQLISRGRDTYF